MKGPSLPRLVAFTCVEPPEDEVVALARLEREVAQDRATLTGLERSLRAMAVEARAALDPAQFRSALLAKRSRPGTAAAVAGFLLGLVSCSWMVMSLGW